MCDRCRLLDRDIENFRLLQKVSNDGLTLALVAEAIVSLEDEKASLHPQDKQ